jgi:hypothetical protein
VDPPVNIENLRQVHDKLIVIKTGPEDGTHVRKHIALDSKLHLLEIVLG